MQILQQPTWQDYQRLHFYPSLQENLSVDAVIVGGGLAGLACAYQLSREGLEVAVLERGRIGEGATGYTTAFLTQAIDTDLLSLEKMFGRENARLVWQSHAQGIDLAEAAVSREGLDCEFRRCSAFVYAQTPKRINDLRAEHATAQSLGLETVLHEDNPFRFANYGALEIPSQAKFHPVKYLLQLSETLVRKGVKIFESTEAVGLREQGGLWEVSVKQKLAVQARSLVLATYYPFTNPRQTRLKRGMYTTYVYEARLPQGLIPEGLYWDKANPYNYFRIDPLDGFDRMIIGGQDHRAEVKISPEKNYAALRDYLRSILPDADFELARRWSGPILEPSDGLALIGETYPNQYVATAFSGNGMTYGLIAGRLIADLVLGRDNQWAHIYDPKRFPTVYQLLKKGKDYIGELLGGAGANIFKPA